MWWLLAREVLRLRGNISREHPWDVMVDLYFYRDPEEAEKEEQAALEKAAAKEDVAETWPTGAELGTATADVTDWASETVPSASAVPITSYGTATEDWSAPEPEWSVPTGAAGAAGTTTTGAAAAQSPAAAGTMAAEWGGSAAENWS